MPSRLEQLQMQFRQRLDERQKERMVHSSSSNPTNGMTVAVVNGKIETTVNNNVTTITKEASWEVSETSSNTIHQKATHINHTSRQQTLTSNGHAQRSRLASSSSTTSSGGGSMTGNGINRPTQLALSGRAGKTTTTSSVRNSTLQNKSTNNGLATSHRTTPTTRSRPSEGYTAGKTTPKDKTDMANNSFKTKSSPTVSKLSSTTKTPISTSRTRSTPMKTPSPANGSLTRGATPSRNSHQTTPTKPAAIKAAPTSQSKPPTNGTAHKKQNGTSARAPVSVSKSQNAGANTSSNSSRKPVREPAADPNLANCHICGRNFAKDRIEKHTVICEKTSTKKKRVFDSTKMRVKGTEAEQYVKRPGSTAKQEVKPKKTNWRSQHENFLAAIREAKRVQEHLAAGGKLSDLPPPPPSENPDYVPCPYCGRKFNEGVAERHIPKCKNIVSNKKTKK